MSDTAMLDSAEGTHTADGRDDLAGHLNLAGVLNCPWPAAHSFGDIFSPLVLNLVRELQVALDIAG
jgi:hypothetical protein